MPHLVRPVGVASTSIGRFDRSAFLIGNMVGPVNVDQPEPVAMGWWCAMLVLTMSGCSHV